MPLSVLTIWAGWVLLVGTYFAVSLIASNGPRLTAFGDIFQCLAAVFACCGLLANSATSERRTRAFWLLLTFGCAAWLAGQFLWTYFEVGLHRGAPDPFAGDVIFFCIPSQ